MTKKKRRGGRQIFKTIIRHSHGKLAISDHELTERRRLIPSDSRDLTARFFGDPIPGDRRRDLFPGDAA